MHREANIAELAAALGDADLRRLGLRFDGIHAQLSPLRLRETAHLGRGRGGEGGP